MTFLITPTLLNSFDYYISYKECRDANEEREKFLSFLKKEKSPLTEPILKGIKFENDVFDFCSDKENITFEDKYLEIIKEVASIVKNGIWQQKIYRKLKIRNQNFIIYGVTDVIKENYVYDIKTTGRYEVGKYSNSMQHIIYCFLTEIYKFKYIITNFKDVYVEEYFLNDEACISRITDAIDTLFLYFQNDVEAHDLFMCNWTQK